MMILPIFVPLLNFPTCSRCGRILWPPVWQIFVITGIILGGIWAFLTIFYWLAMAPMDAQYAHPPTPPPTLVEILIIQGRWLRTIPGRIW